MTQKVCPYEFDMMETSLKMQKNHAYFLAQQNVRSEWKKHDKLEDTVLVKIRAIPGRTTNVN